MKLKSMIRVAAPLLVAMAMAPAPAWAGWKLVAQGKPAAIAETGFTVTPGEDWNRNTARPIPKSEQWTQDGVSLNEIYFVAGLAPGETLFRDQHKKDKPLPALGTGLLLTDLPDFVQTSMRVALDTTAFTIDKVEPVQVAGHPGVSFSFHYAGANSPLRRRGLAGATLVNNQLYLIVYTAPDLYYFDRDADHVKSLIASAKL